MAYNSEGLSLLTPSLSHAGPQLWILQTTDNRATVNTAAYISDAETKGMKAGDVVISVQMTGFTDQYTPGTPTAGNAGSAIYICMSIAADGSADLGDGTIIDTTATD